MSPADSCPSCGAPGMQAYCARCGEKRPDRDDWKLQAIAGEALSEFTNLEHSKLWQTLRLLVLKPGELTREYWAGRRKAYLGPVKLYLVCFALSLLLYSIHEPTAVYDVRTLTAMAPDGTLATRMERTAVERRIDVSVFMQDVSSRWQGYISMSQLAYPLFVALALKLLFIRRRFYFAEHLIFSLHVLAFVFLSFVILWPLYFLAIAPGQNTGSLFTIAYVAPTIGGAVWMLIYLVLALRRAYRENWLRASIAATVVFAVYFVASVAFATASLLLAVART